MALGGSNEPCGYVEVSSIGSLGIEENKKCVNILTDHIQQNIGIPKNKWDEKTYREIKIEIKLLSFCN